MVKPEEIFAEAQKLQAAAHTEMEYRAVIERAYYGAYHAANELEESFPHRSTYTPTNVGEHEALIRRLERPNTALAYDLSIISRDVGTQLKMLRPLRHLATYKIKEAVHITQVEEAMASAKDILTECNIGKRKIAAAKAAPSAATSPSVPAAP